MGKDNLSMLNVTIDMQEHGVLEFAVFHGFVFVLSIQYSHDSSKKCPTFPEFQPAICQLALQAKQLIVGHFFWLPLKIKAVCFE